MIQITLSNKLKKVALMITIVTAVYLRYSLIKENLYFGFEQGRDAYQAMAIWQGKDFALVGPKTDIAGIFHSPIHFYFLALLYGLSGTNPFFVSFVFILINSLATVIIFFVAKQITNNPTLSLVSALLVATSLELVNYGTWLSNVPLSIPFSLLALFKVSKYINTKKYKDWIYGVIFALIACQFEFILYLEWFFLILIMTLYTKHISTKQLIISVGLGLLSVSWLIVFNFIHQWQVFASLNQYTSENHISIISGFSKYLEITQRIIQRTQSFTPLAMALIIPILIYGIVIGLKKKIYRKHTVLLLTFLGMSLPTAFFPGSVMLDQLHVNTGIGLILLIVFSVDVLIKTQNKAIARVFLAILLILPVLNITRGYDPENLFYVSSHGLKICDQIAIIESIKRTNIQPIRFINYTRPYLQPEGWQFLADYYGLKRDDGAKNIYITIEPWVDKFWVDRWTAEIGSTKLLSTQKYGELTLENRIKD